MSDSAIPVRKKRIGEFLIDEGLISAGQLESALESQRKTGKRLGRALIEMGAITESDLAVFLAKQLGIPYLDPVHFTLRPDLIQFVPEHLARRHTIVPVSQVGNSLTLAVEDPLNVIAIDEIQLLTGLTVKPVIAAPTIINAAINEIFGAPEGRGGKKHEGLKALKASDHPGRKFGPKGGRKIEAEAGSQPGFCTSCGKTIDETDSFCRHCGHRQHTKACSGCNRQFELAWNFCPFCGTRRNS